MIKANEARLATENIRNNDIAIQLKNLDEIIKDAIINKKFSINYAGCMYQENKDMLKENGYCVKNVRAGMNEYETQISW